MVFPQHENFALAEKLGLDLVAMTAHVRNGLAAKLATAHDPEPILRDAVLHYGGTLIEPTSNPADANRISNWGPGDYQLALLDCSGTGTTIAEVAADWAKAAARMGDTPDRSAA